MGPIHKIEARSYISNYRPISLLNIMAKVLERIMFITSLGKTLYCQYFSQDFRKVNPQSPNYQKYTTNVVSLLMKIKMLEWYFWIYQKHLIRFGTEM